MLFCFVLCFVFCATLPKCDAGGNRAKMMSTDTVLMSTDTTLFALPFIGGVVLAVPCRVPQNYELGKRFCMYVLRTVSRTCERGPHQSPYYFARCRSLYLLTRSLPGRTPSLVSKLAPIRRHVVANTAARQGAEHGPRRRLRLRRRRRKPGSHLHLLHAWIRSNGHDEQISRKQADAASRL